MRCIINKKDKDNRIERDMNNRNKNIDYNYNRYVKHYI